MAIPLTNDYEDIVLDIVRSNYYMAVLLNSSMQVVSNKIDLVSNGTSLAISGNKLTNPNVITFSCAQGSIVYYLKLYKGGSTAYEATHYMTLPIDGSSGDAFTFTTAGTFKFNQNDINIEISDLSSPNVIKTSQFEEDIMFNFKTSMDRAVILNSSNVVVSDVATIALTSNGSGILYNASDVVFNCDDGVTVYYLKVYQSGYESTRSLKLILEEQNGHPTFSGDGTFTIPAEGITIEF